MLRLTMIYPKSLRSSSVVLGIANLSEVFLPSLRGIILAHLLEPIQFGLAISVILVASTIELISDLGIGQQATRSGKIEDLSTLHSLALVRGSLLAVLIALSGPVFAMLFRAPGTAWVYSFVGLASFIRSFSHLEPRVQMRDYKYTSEALTNLGTQITWTVASLVAAYYIRDYRAMAIGVVVASVSTTIITHCCSASQYRLSWSRETASAALSFGRPLTLNGIALAVSSVGDRFLIGSRIGLDQVAQYTALSTAALLPRSMFVKFATTLFVPQFLNEHVAEGKRRLADAWVLLLTGTGAAFALSFIAFGQPLVTIAFGKHYVPDQPSVSLIAGLACIRYMAAIPTAPSLANGRTSFVLMNTTLSSAGLVIAAITLYFVSSLHYLIGSMLFGETVALLIVLQRLTKQIDVSMIVVWASVLLPLSMLAAAGTISGLAPDMTQFHRIAMCGTGLVIEALCILRLLHYSGSSFRNVLRMLTPKHRRASHAVTETIAEQNG